MHRPALSLPEPTTVNPWLVRAVSRLHESSKEACSPVWTFVLQAMPGSIGITEDHQLLACRHKPFSRVPVDVYCTFTDLLLFQRKSMNRMLLRNGFSDEQQNGLTQANSSAITQHQRYVGDLILNLNFKPKIVLPYARQKAVAPPKLTQDHCTMGSGDVQILYCKHWVPVLLPYKVFWSLHTLLPFSHPISLTTSQPLQQKCTCREAAGSGSVLKLGRAVPWWLREVDSSGCNTCW